MDYPKKENEKQWIGFLDPAATGRGIEAAFRKSSQALHCLPHVTRHRVDLAEWNAVDSG